MPRTISVAYYIFKRLQQNGVNQVFGVPGDYMLKALDHVKAAGVKWIGTCNELNAGYAADGYARINGLGALFTTYGVGELSAINAFAGSIAEQVPVVHVVGLPQRHLIESGALVHHALGADRLVFASMHKKMGGTSHQSQQFPKDEEDIIKDIDRPINTALEHRKPAYLLLPSDMVARQIDERHLNRPLGSGADQPQDQTRVALEKILPLVYQAKAPLLLIDRMGMDDLDIRRHLNNFVRHSGIPTITMPSGAGMVDHDTENYFGVHAGPVGQIDTMPYVNNCDLVIAFGPMFSDTQTLGWSVVPPAARTIRINTLHAHFPNDQNDSIAISLEKLLRTMTRELDPGRLAKPDTTLLGDFRKILPQPITNLEEPLDQTNFYLRLNSYLRPHDTILLGNATPILGGRDFVLPDSSCRVIASGLWFSIGHMLPAALGAAMAQQRSPQSSIDTKRGRVVLFDGDGSFQVTAQELSTIIHQRLNVTIFIINNEGYAYERLIHNPDADYHDVAPWNYLSLPAAFGAAEAIKKAQHIGEEYSVDIYTMRTWWDLEAFLSDETFDNGFDGKGPRGLKLVDVRMARTDVTEKFKAIFESAGKNLG